MSKMQAISIVIWLSASPAIAVETIEALGGERCGGAATESTIIWRCSGRSKGEVLLPSGEITRRCLTVGGVGRRAKAPAVVTRCVPCSSVRRRVEASTYLG
jgi:hypothetical protein